MSSNFKAVQKVKQNKSEGFLSAHTCHKSRKQEKRNMNSDVNWYCNVYWSYKNKQGKCKHNHKVFIFSLKTSDIINSKV